MNRRSFLKGIAGILGAGYSASILPSGVIMPIKQLWTPEITWALTQGEIIFYEGLIYIEMSRKTIYSNNDSIHSWDVVPIHE